MPSQESQRFLQEREFWFPCGAYRMRYLHVPADSPPPRLQPAVVFVHGLMGYSFSWRHNLEFFSRHRDVYAVDLLGIGHSDRPETGAVDFGMAAAAARLLGFVRSLGHSQVDLVGTSHGGAVAMLAASQDCSYPEAMIRRLVLVAPAHPFMTNAHLRLTFFRTPFGRMLLRGLIWPARRCAPSRSAACTRMAPGSRRRRAPDMRSISMMRAPTTTPSRSSAPGGRTCCNSGRRCTPSPPFPFSCSGGRIPSSPPRRGCCCASSSATSNTPCCRMWAICLMRRRRASSTAGYCGSCRSKQSPVPRHPAVRHCGQCHNDLMSLRQQFVEVLRGVDRGAWLRFS